MMMPSEKVVNENLHLYDGISVFELSKTGMPQKGLEKGDGVPPSLKLWRDKLGKRKRTFPY
jgi:hypothetical protein